MISILLFFMKVFLYAIKKILGNHCHNHPSHLLIRWTATLTVSKPSHKKKHAMIVYLRNFNQVKNIKAICGIVKLHRGIASSP